MTARKNSTMRAAAARTAATTPPPGATAIDTRPIRTTVDLDRTLWADVQAWLSIEQARSRQKITTAHVLRALLHLLVEDPEVARATLDRMSQ
jgi:hypothetical protein